MYETKEQRVRGAGSPCHLAVAGPWSPPQSPALDLINDLVVNFVIALLMMWIGDTQKSNLRATLVSCALLVLNQGNPFCLLRQPSINHTHYLRRPSSLEIVP